MLADLENKLAEVRQEMQLLPTRTTTNPEDFGMTQEYNLVLAEFAVANDLIIILRPVNKSAVNKLKDSDNPCMGKGLQLKAKSSEFGPIAGDIPCEAGLSKLAIKEQHLIAGFNHKNEELLAKDSEEYASEKDNINKDKIASYNDRMFVTAKTKRTANGKKIIHYFVDANGNIIWNQQKTSPLFAVGVDKERKSWRLYDEKIQGFSTEAIALEPGVQCRKVKIMAYRQFVLDNENNVTE